MLGLRACSRSRTCLAAFSKTSEFMPDRHRANCDAKALCEMNRRKASAMIANPV